MTRGETNVCVGGGLIFLHYKTIISPYLKAVSERAEILLTRKLEFSSHEVLILKLVSFLFFF